MKMKKTAGLSAILFLCLAVPVRAQDGWEYLGNDATGSDFYLNRRSVEKQRDYVTGWVRVVLSDADKSEPYMQALAYVYGREPSYNVSLVAARKGSRQISTFQLATYDRNGNLIYSQSVSSKWEYCIPNTSGEFIWYALMVAAGVRF